jgi:hypothetical protein
LEPREPIFENGSHLREKRGVLMILKKTPHLEAKAQYDDLYRNAKGKDYCRLGKYEI